MRVPQGAMIPPLPMTPELEKRFSATLLGANGEYLKGRVISDQIRAAFDTLVKTSFFQDLAAGKQSSGSMRRVMDGLLLHALYVREGRHSFTLPQATVHELWDLSPVYLTPDEASNPEVPWCFLLRADPPILVLSDGGPMHLLGWYVGIFLTEETPARVTIHASSLIEEDGVLQIRTDIYTDGVLVDPDEPTGSTQMRRVVVNAVYAIHHRRVGDILVPRLGFTARQSLQKLAKTGQMPKVRTLTLSLSGRATLESKVVRPPVVEALTPPVREPSTPSGEPMAEHTVKGHDHCVWVRAANLQPGETYEDQRVGKNHIQLYKVRRFRGDFSRGTGPAREKQTRIRPAGRPPEEVSDDPEVE